MGSSHNCVYRLTDGGCCPVFSGDTFATSSAVKSTPAAYSGNIYFGCDDGNIYCVDASTLQQCSVKSVGSEIVSSPAVSAENGLVFVASRDGRVCALDAGDLATERWAYDIRAREGKLDATIRSSPTLADSKLFIVVGYSGNRYLYCFGD